MKLPAISPRQTLLLMALVAIAHNTIPGDETDSKPTKPRMTVEEYEAKIRQRLMPKVGKEVTVTGRLERAMQGMFVASDDGPVYLQCYEVPAEERSKWNDLIRSFEDERIQVTGTLHFSKALKPKQPRDKRASPAQPKPEFFFIDVTTAEIERVEQ